MNGFLTKINENTLVPVDIDGTPIIIKSLMHRTRFETCGLGKYLKFEKIGKVPKKPWKHSNYVKNDRVYVIIYNGHTQFNLTSVKSVDYMVNLENGMMSVPTEMIFPYGWYTFKTNCRLAIREWLLISRRIPGVYKDLRLLICKYLWKTKNSDIWQIE